MGTTKRSYKMIPLEKKILAVEIVQRLGGRVTENSINEVRRALEIPTLDASNIRKWMWQFKNVKRPQLPTGDRGRVSYVREVYDEAGNLVTYSEKDNKAVVINENNELVRLDLSQIAKDMSDRIDKKYAEAADKFLEHATDPEVIKNMRGIDAMKAASLAAAIAQKSHLSSEISPEIAVLIPHIIKGIQRRGLDPYTTFYNMMIKLNQPIEDGEKAEDEV